MAITHKDHNGDENYELSFEDEIFSLSEIKGHKPEETKTKKSFVFSESMLENFDPMMN